MAASEMMIEICVFCCTSSMFLKIVMSWRVVDVHIVCVCAACVCVCVCVCVWVGMCVCVHKIIKGTLFHHDKEMCLASLSLSESFAL